MVRRLHIFIADTDILIFEVFNYLLIMQKKEEERVEVSRRSRGMVRERRHSIFAGLL